MPRRDGVTAERIASHVSDLVAAEAPDGLTDWPGLMTVVGEAMDAFFDCLSEFEREDCPRTRGEVNRAIDRVLASWRVARREWERRKHEGRGVPA